ncbi:MAG TPA: hypothetical protein H9829_00305 [Candidatus Tetragenococcus pullicola]|nr:hypothetical protein [Candidatus Tetragenococcus pullicola]
MKNNYDERQLLIRYKGFKYSYMISTTMILFFSFILIISLQKVVIFQN